MVDIEQLNKQAWDRAVGRGDNPYATAVSATQINEARQGNWVIYLSDIKPVPRTWFGKGGINGRKILCLASGGGQQAPILAAAGAKVVSFDLSPQQLALDQAVAQQHGLTLQTVQGNMADLSTLADASFDLIVNPPSTLFVPDLAPIWRECYRVLRPGGVVMTGFLNPDEFIFDPEAIDHEGVLRVKYPLPYVEHETLDEAALAARITQREMFHFSHSLEGQLGGLIAAGFAITGFYEDRRPDADGNPIRHYMPSYYVAKAQKE